MPTSTDDADVQEHAELLIALFQAEQCLAQQDWVGALTKFTAALAFDPRRADVWMHVGRTYLKMENWAQAIPALETALALQPGMPDAQHGLSFALFNLGRHAEALEMIDDVCRRGNNPSMWVMRAFLHGQIDRDPVKTLEVYRDWGRRYADPLTRKAAPLAVADRRPKKRLKVGYVTADFREHSVAFFMLPVLRHHDPQEVEVHVYSGGRRDGITDALQQCVPHWHEMIHLSDDDLYTLIRSHGIDVLVDLSGHTAGNRLLVFARRAAPVQVTWLGFMSPLGMKAMDYRLTDAGITPPGHEVFYSERLFRLACMASYAPPTYAPLCEEPPLLRNGYPTLISLNNSAKVTDRMLGVWARILQARTDARLVIMVKERSAEAAQANMQMRVEAAGMPIDRVFVLHQQPLGQFMELGHIADVALDTTPISGGTTTLHALWMGLPVVAMDAERGIDASSARTLQGLGFGGEVAQDEVAYVAAALRLMDDPEGLLQLRRNGREWMGKSVLMDYAARTAELEKAYRLMWLNYLNRDARWLDVEVDLGAALAQAERAQPQPQRLAGNG
ncbi:O-linked N-acetylglucosamine transferase, SPINDLY family protein [Acidovorax sp. NCPPB 3576]|uniref:O-linked N-acetylglucosamine transferase, SPINDLY family protein n=1 Tax=Acidovorax sp. NCPPB 3576 TaxID=2940488 RepID=UPI00234A1F04|nr:tetratricopeptide repeat protein [Acidovorax sp. NCPPB 3576]WCM88956.1 tetratricopeptide repeat protein [Acidovorax sp. NCPPB 3576]